MMNRLSHHSTRKISPGSNTPQGATLNDDGVNFSIHSHYAERVFLLLFNKPESTPSDVIEMTNKTGNLWHVFVHGLKAGQLYGYKIDGKYDPVNGYRFNPSKCLIDPYARAVTGKFDPLRDSVYGYDRHAKNKDLSLDSNDNVIEAPKCIVIDNSFDWQGDRPPNIPLSELIIYELHLKGFTAHPSSQVTNKGTYLGLIEKIPYLKELGINAVELLPVHEHYNNEFLVNKGLTNYWGYDTIGFFAPESSYSANGESGKQVEEFKTLVRELHKAQIEVILDVVYNHTGEGNELGPTICFRGIDNQTYYALHGTADQPYRYYRDNAGTGNIINIENPQVLNLVIDSLRYWVEVMHVDGFRFDLATILGYKNGKFSSNNIFFKKVARDPVLKKVKFIAEPWDVTTYQLGHFPRPWAEWNGKFRDSARRFLKGDPGQIKDLAWRLAGSQDLFDDRRTPMHSINFITCHDGFTLNDLYSYNDKHNQANHEKNGDGSNENFSWNCGAEGDTDDEAILKLRKQMAKNGIACLLLSLGTPLILGGDEFLRTQQGNNNAYCQDNEISWFDWQRLQRHQDIFQFMKQAISLRKQYTIFQKDTFFSGKDHDGNSIPDVAWFGPDLEKPDWDDPQQKILCYLLDGGETVSDRGNYFLFFIMNAEPSQQLVKLPDHKKMWRRLVDTSLEPGLDIDPNGAENRLDNQQTYDVQPHSVVVLLGHEKSVDSSYYSG